MVVLRGRTMKLEKEKWIFSILFHYFYVRHTHIHWKKEQGKGRLPKDQWASGYCKITSYEQTDYTYLDCAVLSQPLTLNPMSYSCYQRLHLQNVKVSMAITCFVKKRGICSNTVPQKQPAHPKKKKIRKNKTKTKSPATLNPYNSLPNKYQLQSNHVTFDQATQSIVCNISLQV